VSFYDHFAHASRTKLGGWIKWQTKQRELALFVAMMPKRGAAILEIGPGKGEFSELLRQAGYTNYRTVEPNAAMREELRARGFMVSDYQIPILQEPDASADAILLVDVFEHLDGPVAADQFMQEARRVLRNGGVLCLACPDYLHWGSDFFNCDYTHNNVTTVRRAQQHLYGSGFIERGHLYFSGHLTGWPATWLSLLARLSLSFARSNGMDMKAYKLKLTFLRRFWIVGQKPNA
jgi:SAM-dependent methyltransferase